MNYVMLSSHTICLLPGKHPSCHSSNSSLVSVVVHVELIVVLLVLPCHFLALGNKDFRMPPDMKMEKMKLHTYNQFVRK